MRAPVCALTHRSTALTAPAPASSTPTAKRRMPITPCLLRTRLPAKLRARAPGRMQAMAAPALAPNSSSGGHTEGACKSKEGTGVCWTRRVSPPSVRWSKEGSRCKGGGGVLGDEQEAGTHCLLVLKQQVMAHHQSVGHKGAVQTSAAWEGSERISMLAPCCLASRCVQ